MFKPDFSVKTYAEGKINSGMIDANKLPEFPGFSVYDIETGEKVEPHDGMSIYYGDLLLKNPISGREVIFALDEDGALCIVPKEQAYQAYRVSKEGKYIIQLGNGEYYRW